MRILKATLTVTRPDRAAAFYRDVLELPVTVHDGRVRVRVRIGFSSLVLEQGDDFHGVHHLAFGVAPADFELARTWLRRRVEPIMVDGSDIVEGPDGWNSRSLYFFGPEAILLELIARDADAHVPATPGQVPRLLSLSEVGIGVPDVTQAVHTLEQHLGLPAFPPQGTQFAPVGGHNGLIILVDQDRIWFPTQTQQAAHGPVTVELAAPRPGRMSLRKAATILTGN